MTLLILYLILIYEVLTNIMLNMSGGRSILSDDRYFVLRAHHLMIYEYSYRKNKN